MHRIEKALSPLLRKAAKLASAICGEGVTFVQAQLAARKAAADAAAASGLPGGLKAFGTMSFGEADVAGGGKDFLPASADFPEPLAAEVRVRVRVRACWQDGGLAGEA